MAQQASKSIREGLVPVLRPYAGKGIGIFFVESPKQLIQDTVLDIVHDLGGIGSSQVISPLQSGPSGRRR